MKLTEAIRLGSVLGPQITNGYFTDDEGGSCAIGAAFLALGKRETIESYPGPNWLLVAASVFPSLAMPLPGHERFSWTHCSGMEFNVDSVGELVVYLNDRARLSRQEIADLLVEDSYDCEAVSPVPAEAAEEEVFAAV